MSRARPVHLPDGQVEWFDTSKNTEQASDEQLELLSVIEDTDLDDLLDAVLSQGEVLFRLREVLGQNAIPEDVVSRRQKWRDSRQIQPQCRICGKEGDSTKHHFVPKWILRELEQYGSKWSDRSKNCVPVCMNCHRHLHMRDNSEKSFVRYLTEDEKDYVENALTRLAEERPKLLILIGRGSPNVYESRLIQDWMEGKFLCLEN